MFNSNKSLVFIISLLLLAGITIGAMELTETPTKAPEADGEQLEKRIWKAMANTNMSWVKDHVASSFQSVHSDGARDRSGELKLIKGLNLGEYELRNFKTTQVDGQIIVTYSVSVMETIAGERTSSDPAPRLSVWTWQPDDEVWQWTAHANLKPLQK